MSDTSAKSPGKKKPKRKTRSKARRDGKATVKPAESGSLNGAAIDTESLTKSSLEPVLCIVATCENRLWGLSTEERLKTQFKKNGVTGHIGIEKAASHAGPVILVRADAVIDQPLIPILARRPNLMLTSEEADGSVPLAVTVNGRHAEQAAKLLDEEAGDPAKLQLLVRAPSGLDANFHKTLRKLETPYALQVKEEKRREIEWRMFMATYKGATDFVTKFVWPRPAFHATRAIAPTSITPNMVTTVGAVCVVAAYWFFSQGQFALGLAAAWLMTFLDTVDGKLARTTLTSSRWGDVFDHGIDLVHPPFWYFAWGGGLAVAGFAWSQQFFWLVFGIILGGYVLQRIMEGIAIKWLGLEIHIWRPVDTWFRLITARRNPNLAILTAGVLIGRPDLGLLAVAIWTLICLVLHGLQIIQAFFEKSRSGPLASWMSKPRAGK